MSDTHDAAHDDATPQGPEVAPGLRVLETEGLHRWWLCNEARRNAVTPGALRWIAQRAPSLRGEIVVLRGAGRRSFCAGFDLTALADATNPAAVPSAHTADPSSTPSSIQTSTAPSPPTGPVLPDAPLIAASTAMLAADATFVAVLDGYVIGAGVELACACDLRLARHGIYFAIPAARLGVVYHADGLASIRAVFGPAGVRRLLLLGERVDAQQALAAGALVRCVDDSAALDHAVAEVLARLRAAAPLSVQGNRDLLRVLDRGAPSPAQRSAHDQRRVAAYASEDLQEAQRARLQDRAPRFSGR